MDRNKTLIILTKQLDVALRKESVDRNHDAGPRANLNHVALRKESVDRNSIPPADDLCNFGRSPQGERG